MKCTDELEENKLLNTACLPSLGESLNYMECINFKAKTVKEGGILGNRLDEPNKRNMINLGHIPKGGQKNV